MIRTCGILMVLLLAAVASADELTLTTIDTGAVPCDGAWHAVAWQAEPIRAIRLRATELAAWTAPNTRGNILLALTAVRASGAMRLQTYGWNHYAEPTAPPHQRQVFAPDWVTLAAWERVELQALCTATVDGVPTTIHGSAVLTYTAP